MANQNLNSPMPTSGGETEKELFSENKKKFIEDLECLYIRNNQSGRLLFADKWPQIAKRLFDPQLVKFDYEGVANEEEREKREMLEFEAEVKRDELLNHFSGMEKRLVVYGSLVTKELDKLMANLDRTLAELIFAERFVDKYFPKAPGAPKPAAADNDQAEAKKDDGSMPSDTAAQENAPETADQQSGQAEGEQAQERKPKESVVVPEIETDSIGHVDHSYNTKAPDYDAPKKEGSKVDMDDAASWLDMPEDEFGDVMPISTEPQQGSAPPAEAPAETAPEEPKSAPSMGLKAHQDGRPPAPSAPEPFDDDDDKPLFVAGEQTGGDAPSGYDQAPPSSAPPSSPQGGPPKSAPPHEPPGQQQPRQTAPDPVGAPEPPPTPLDPQRAVPEQEASRASSPPPPPSSGMGLRAHQHNQGQGQSAPPPPSQSAPPTPQSQSSSAPPLPGAGSNPPPLPGSGGGAPPPPPQDAAPKRPSLDDIDKHLGDKPKGPPPLPGSDDDNRGY